MSLLLISATLVGLFTWLVLYLRNKWSFWTSRGIPQPPIWEVLAGRFRERFFLLDQRWVKKYGKIVGLYDGLRPSLLITDPELIKQITVKDFNVFPNHRNVDFQGSIVGKNLFNLNGSDEAWKRVRAIMSPTFTSGKMRGMTDKVNGCIDTLLENLEECSSTGKPVDIKLFYGAFTMDIICSTAFGIKTDSKKDPNNPMVTAARKVFSREPTVKQVVAFLFPRIGKLFGIEIFDRDVCDFFSSLGVAFLFPRIGKLFGIEIFEREVCDFFGNITRKIADKRRADIANGTKSSHNVDFIQLMLEAQEKEVEIVDNEGKITSKKLKLSDEELAAQGLIFFLAGYDTTATTLSYAAYLLGKNPEIQEKLIKEVDAIDEADLNYDTVGKLQLTDAVIWETLRLYPAVIRLERESVAEYKLGDTGIVLPPKTLVGFPIYAMHRDASNFSDPETFNPERFVKAGAYAQGGSGLASQANYAAAASHPYAYAPFGLGPRICVGMRLALLETTMCLARVMKKYRFKSTVEPDNYLGNLLLAPKEIYVTVEKR